MGKLIVFIAVIVVVMGWRKLPELFGAVFSAKKAFREGLEEGEEGGGEQRPHREVKEIHTPEEPRK